MKKFLFGFNIAEVLITLGIIGIVAEITIPPLIINYKKTQYVTQLKKFYSTFNQVLLEIALEGGCIDNLKCALPTGGSADCDIIASKFKVIKNCGNLGNLGEGVCFPNNLTYVYDDERGLGASEYDTFGDYYRFVTADGMAVALPLGAGLYSGEPLLVDVNGPLQKPNQVGRDVFMFKFDTSAVSKPNLKPFAYAATSYCNPTQKYSGDCAYRIMQEGWQMNY